MMSHVDSYNLKACAVVSPNILMIVWGCRHTHQATVKAHDTIKRFPFQVLHNGRSPFFVLAAGNERNTRPGMGYTEPFALIAFKVDCLYLEVAW